MKKIINLMFLAVVTLLITACSSDKVVPKALFSYEVHGDSVFFTNLSQNATSYSWDFGDNTTSSEENPVHLYSTSGTFTVILTAMNDGESSTYTDQVSISKPLIKIDGNFSDWSDVPADKLATATLPEGASLTALKELKVCADENFIYFYLKLDQVQVAPLDIFINSDNNAATGGNSWLWDPCGADYLIEGFLNEGMADAAVYNWPADKPQDGWEWVEAVPAGSGIISMSEVKTVSGTIVQLEASIVKELLPATLANQIGIGVFSSNADWAETGSLPSVSAESEIKAPLLTVKLN
ncbi:PKD domain-containing protein [Porphyromonadaceae sp. NP-X]|jgi:hypothetical protein|nr:PKD domain-containing protein [Porphyromonadaceae sp. NP-X]NMB82593.1 PKD domain-containing protein [Ignavibacteria bacterium]